MSIIQKLRTAVSRTVERLVRWALSHSWKATAIDLQAVADDYALKLRRLDDLSELRHVHISGRGRKWRGIIEASHDDPLIRVDGNDPLEVITELTANNKREPLAPAKENP